MKKFISITLALLIIVSQACSVLAADVDIVVTNRTVKESNKFMNIDLSLPHIKGAGTVDEINKIINNIEKDSIAETKELAEYLTKESVAWKVLLDINYDYFLNRDILSIQLNQSNYSGGAHGMHHVLPITANISTGQIYKFKDLFTNPASAKIIENIIIQTINKSPEYYFDNYAESIKKKNTDFSFYIDGNRLVVFFGLYEIAPYASDLQRFVFEAEQIKDILKDEIYNSMKDSRPLKGILFNGRNLNSDKIVDNGYGVPMAPLRIVAESLGYKVAWNKTDGITLNGKSLSNVDYKMINNHAYLPIEYFTDVLGEDVDYGYLDYINTSKAKFNIEDNIVIRIFKDNLK